MNATLKKHLDENLPPNGRITIRDKKVDGTKWRSCTFPEGVFVKLP